MNIRKLLTATIATAVLSLSLVGAASAAHLNLNSSFETGVDPGVFTTLNAGDTTSIDNWTVAAGSVDYIGSYWAAVEGTRSLDMSGNDAGAVSKTFATVPGHTYMVKFALAGNPDGGPTEKTLAVDAGGTPTTYTFDTTGKTRTDMGWEPKVFTFTATSTNTTLTFTSLTPGFYGPALDNVVMRNVTVLGNNKNLCKNGGWEVFTSLNFKNQGDCVSYVQSSAKAVGNKANNN